jgi:Zn-finger nucleic acid-binding protein
MNAVDIYNRTGEIPCPKCGINLLESEYYKVICNDPECKGMIIRKETLKKWAKEQGKELTPKLNKLQ